MLYEAHRGAENEAPENTFSSITYAIKQGYDFVEIDLKYTKDGKIVLLHDYTLDRTAIKDGKEVKNVQISELTYKEVLQYDVGAKFSAKFTGEKVPLFSEIITLAEDNGIILKTDNVVHSFPEKVFEDFINTAKGHEKCLSVTCFDIESVKKTLKYLPDITVHYDGKTDGAILKELSSLVPKERLFIWLPVKCERTFWSKCTFADDFLVQEAKKYARLGLWIIDSREEFNRAVNWGADIIETSGSIKKEMNAGKTYDMHTHCLFSHDSNASPEEMYRCQKERNTANYAMTDHYDVCTSDFEPILLSIAKAKELGTLRGIELADGNLNINDERETSSKKDYDVILGSVHASDDVPPIEYYSRTDFSSYGEKEIEDFLNTYFDCVLRIAQNCNFDILTHLTCPLRYICGKYGKEVDLNKFSKKTDAILKEIIRKGIALEVNTSCLDSPYNELMPNKNILMRYFELGGYLITLGSDAHISQNASHGFTRAKEVLKNIGFENIYFFENRIPIQCKLI